MMSSISSPEMSVNLASEPSGATLEPTKISPPVMSSPTFSPESPRMMMRPPYIM